MGRRSLLGAVICIAISLVPLTALLVVSEGMIEGMTERIIHLSTHDIQIEPASTSFCTSSFEAFTQVSERLLSVNSIKKVYPEIQYMNLASANAVRSGALVRAVDENIFKDRYFSSLFEVCEGECDLSAKRSVIISSKMAETLGVKPGDRISLINVNVSEGNRLSPRAFPFTVKAVVSSGYQELDELWAFISLREGFEVLSRSSSSFIIGLSTDNTFSPLLNKTLEEVFSYLCMDEAFDIYGTSVSTWKEINSAQFENFSSTKILLFLIMILIVLVASANISSALVMIVLERSAEIGILKTMGSSSSGLRAAFIMTGGAAGFAGVLTGIPLGLLTAVNINSIISGFEKFLNFIMYSLNVLFEGKNAGYESFRLLDPAFYIQKIDINIPFEKLFLVALSAVLLSLLVSVLPSRKAGREKIMDTLRKN